MNATDRHPAAMLLPTAFNGLLPSSSFCSAPSAHRCAQAIIGAVRTLWLAYANCYIIRLAVPLSKRWLGMLEEGGQEENGSFPGCAHESGSIIGIDGIQNVLSTF